MTYIVKELTSEHIIGYGVEIVENDINIVFQLHPEIEKWLKAYNIFPEYGITEEVPGYNISITDFSIDRNTPFPIKEQDYKRADFEIDELLSKIKVVVSLSKHEAKFKFPVFKKTPELSLTNSDMQKLVDEGVWDTKTYHKNKK